MVQTDENLVVDVFATCGTFQPAPPAPIARKGGTKKRASTEASASVAAASGGAAAAGDEAMLSQLPKSARIAISAFTISVPSTQLAIKFSTEPRFLLTHCRAGEVSSENLICFVCHSVLSDADGGHVMCKEGMSIFILIINSFFLFLSFFRSSFLTQTHDGALFSLTRHRLLQTLGTQDVRRLWIRRYEVSVRKVLYGLSTDGESGQVEPVAVQRMQSLHVQSMRGHPRSPVRIVRQAL